jgi:hypothetical protein
VGSVSEPTPDFVATDWLTVEEVARRLSVSPGRVRRLIDEGYLVGSRRRGPFAVPSVFLVEDQVLGSLRGTLFVLRDGGFSDDEAIDWLLTSDETLATAPVEALRRGRKSEVRRLAKILA